MVLVIGILNITVGIFGTTLNNARLIDNDCYEREKGDYPIFFFLFLILSVIFFFCMVKWSGVSISLRSSVLLLFSVIFIVSSSYFSAEFRINLHYKKILIGKILLGAGYLFGIFLFQATECWEFIFFFGYGFEFLFCLVKTTLWKESLHMTNHFMHTLRRIVFLLLSAILGSTVTYLDRLIIFPIFGGAKLASYYAASVVGKSISLVTTPISGVILSYLSKSEKLRLRLYIPYVITIIFFCLIGYYLCIWISKPVINLLYPDLFQSAVQYVSVTVLASIFGIVYSFTWPIVLRFGKDSFPLIIITAKTVVYIVVAILLTPEYKVMGVAMANAFASATSATIVVMLGLYIAIKNRSSFGKYALQE